MTALDEIARMQSLGMSQDSIVSQLRAKGTPESEIANAISASQIKQAVSSGDQNIFGESAGGPIPPNQFPGGAQTPGVFDQHELSAPSPGQGVQFGSSQGQQDFGQPSAPQEQSFGQSGTYPSFQGGQTPDAYSAYSQNQYPAQEGSGEYSGMQPSIMSQAPQEGYEKVGGEYGGAQQQYGEVYQQPMYQPYQETMSTDVITEISEQIVNEKLSGLHDKIEKILDMRTVVEANMNNLNDRLKRMEKIVDQMQVSILKKVGEYLTDVQDVKKELEETQKSFVSMAKKKKK